MFARLGLLVSFSIVLVLLRGLLRWLVHLLTFQEFSFGLLRFLIHLLLDFLAIEHKFFLQQIFERFGFCSISGRDRDVINVHSVRLRWARLGFLRCFENYDVIISRKLCFVRLRRIIFIGFLCECRFWLNWSIIFNPLFVRRARPNDAVFLFTFPGNPIIELPFVFVRLLSRLTRLRLIKFIVIWAFP